MTRLMTTAFTALALLAVAPAAFAQAPSAAGQDRGGAPLGGIVRWDAWLGCWTPNELRPPARDVRLCVVPNADRTGVRLVTFAGDQQIVAEESLVADGSRRTVSERGCTGTRETRFATVGERLFTTAELRCDGADVVPSATLTTLTSPNRWLDIQVTGAPGRQSVRTAHYVRSTEPPPAAVADQLSDLSFRHGITVTPITIEDITEATKALPSPAVELWLAEVEPRLPINRQTLTQLADARVAEPVIDLLVGLAYPNRFRIERISPPDLLSAGYIGPMLPLPFPDASVPWSPFAWFPMGPIGMMAYGMYGSYYPYYPGWGAGQGYFWPIVNPGGGGGGGVAGPSGRGRVVNGSGYTRVEEIPTATSSHGGGDRGMTTFSGSSGDGGVSPAGFSGGGGGGGGAEIAVPR